MSITTKISHELHVVEGSACVHTIELVEDKLDCSSIYVVRDEKEVIKFRSISLENSIEWAQLASDVENSIGVVKQKINLYRANTRTHLQYLTAIGRRARLWSMILPTSQIKLS